MPEARVVPDMLFILTILNDAQPASHSREYKVQDSILTDIADSGQPDHPGR
jgi:hypothetical protein